MIEYRRGTETSRKNDLWHYNPDCRSWPAGAYHIRTDKPDDDDLCACCESARAPSLSDERPS